MREGRERAALRKKKHSADRPRETIAFVRRKQEKRKETRKNSPLSSVPVGARRGDGLNDDCVLYFVFMRERERERGQKGSERRDTRRKRQEDKLPDRRISLSPRVGRRSSGRRGGPPSPSRLRLLRRGGLLRSSSAAVAAAVAAAAVNSSALLGAGGLGRLSLFFVLIVLFSLDERRLLRERRLMPFLLQSLASSFLPLLTRITHARAGGLDYLLLLGNILEWVCFLWVVLGRKREAKRAVSAGGIKRKKRHHRSKESFQPSHGLSPLSFSPSCPPLPSSPSFRWQDK